MEARIVKHGRYGSATVVWIFLLLVSALIHVLLSNYGARVVGQQARKSGRSAAWNVSVYLSVASTGNEWSDSSDY